DRGFQAIVRMKTNAIWRSCQAVVTSNAENEDKAEDVTGGQTSIGRFRHGIDHSTWQPNLRDRAWLQNKYDIHPECPVVAFAGRLDATKSVPLLTEAVQRLAATGQDVHLLAAGSGPAGEAMKRDLGPRVTL